MTGTIVEIVNKYGFPIAAATGMGYLIYYVWKWVTTEIKPILKETTETTINLIDSIRMLDNDLIRLDQKVDTILGIRGGRNTKKDESKTHPPKSDSGSDQITS